jgi:hypothetical protein
MAPFVVKTSSPSLDEAAVELGLSRSEARRVDRMLFEARLPARNNIAKRHKQPREKTVRKKR